MKRILLVAFHFPPIQGSSGYLRTLKFTRYLPEFGCEPIVLTVRPGAYGAVNPRGLEQIPAGLEVHRSFAFDLPKLLSIRGRHFSWMSIPDRYSPWIPFAVMDGLRLIRKRGIDAIFSTYPIPGAHVIGGMLHRLSGKPWVADFRDPMWDDYSRQASLSLSVRKAVERRAIERATAVVVATRGMKSMYAARYPGMPAGKTTVILNGFDEEDFAGMETPPRRNGGPAVLIHAGLLERIDRNPEAFFLAVKSLRDSGKAGPERLRVRLIATGQDGEYRKNLEALGIADMVRLEPAIPYGEALSAMAASDVLLLFQGPTCDAQIPAKLYEYMRVGKPILALATESGETGRLVIASGGGKVVPIGDAAAIAACLEEWLESIEAGRPLPATTAETASAYARRNQAGQLADIFRGL
ncbi:MAG TPA: glycosyltransferase [Fibrobacteria bacterium]|nr:glycosyltransferase [Fibrobacteria bacterium]